MKEQNFKNHVRLVPLFHFGLLAIVLAEIVLSLLNLFRDVSLTSVLLVLIAFASLIGFLKIRRFPIAVQDRAIRTEENLRHFALTGKLLDSRLRLDQIIGLRFAPDAEFVALAKRAVDENLSNKQIKQAVQNWKADHHRA